MATAPAFTIMTRPITEADLPALLDLYTVLYPIPTDPDKMLANFRKMAANPDYLVVGAFTDEGELVGSALAIICLDILADCQPWAMVENVITAPQMRGQGVGRKVMEALEAFVQARGCSYIQLTTTKPEAYAFYQAIGYSGDLVRAFRKQWV